MTGGEDDLAVRGVEPLSEDDPLSWDEEPFALWEDGFTGALGVDPFVGRDVEPFEWDIDFFQVDTKILCQPSGGTEMPWTGLGTAGKEMPWTGPTG